MRIKGQVTVFISLVMMCVFALLCCLVESARTAGSRWYLQMASSSALDSVFSQYHRPLWDKYRVLFAEYEDEELMAADYLGFLNPYLETENWYPMTAKGVEVEERLMAVDDHGQYLEQEILDYMHYGIWDLDFDEKTVVDLWADTTEAKAVTAMAGSYRGHAKEALNLERALEKISDNIENQKSWKQKGLSCLRSYDGPGFRRAAEQLILELKKMPDLVAKYKKQADILARGLEKSYQSYAETMEDISDDVKDMLEQEIRQYESYVALDGEHRMEIESQEQRSREQIILIKEVIEEALEVERIIDEWEDDDDDDDGPDLASLWSPVTYHFERYQVADLSFVHGVADKEKEGWLKSVEQMCQGQMLDLVIPSDVEVSAAILDLTDAPSRTEMWSAGVHDVSLMEHILINEYCGDFFSNFLSGESNYEMEYLLEGLDTDKGNMEAVVSRLLAVREGLNLIHIISNPEKREMAQNLALVISGAGAVTPIVFVVAFFIMSIWALGESLMDIRGLLAGKNVVILKSVDTWTLTLDQLLTMGSQGEIGTGGGESGLGYLSWLKILLFLEEIVQQDFRMMDMMQMNLRKEQSNFRMRHMTYQTRIRTTVCGKHVFFSLGFVENLTGSSGTPHTMSMETVVERQY